MEAWAPFGEGRGDMFKIGELDKKQSAFFSHYDPNMVEWFAKMVEECKKQHDCTKEKKNW